MSEVERTKERSYLTPSAYDKSTMELKMSIMPEESWASSWHVILWENTREMPKCMSPLAL